MAYYSIMSGLLVSFVIYLCSKIVSFQELQSYSDNQINIPSVGISVQVFSGKFDEVLSRGAWRIDGVNPPDSSENVVVVGHRLRAGAPLSQSFFNLPNIKIGDEIELVWHGVHYHYIVDTVTIVKPTEKIELQTKEQIITLITCTPFPSSRYRLIVKGHKNADFKE